VTRGEPFRMGGHGIPTLCAFLTGPLLVLMPILGFISSRLMRPREVPPGCGPLKAAEIARRMAGPLPGGAAADGARTAMGFLADELLAVLTDTLNALVSAQGEDFDHLDQGVTLPSAASTSATTSATAVQTKSLPRLTFPRSGALSESEFQQARRRVERSLVASYRKQLAALEEVVRGYISQLKGLNVKVEKPGRSAVQGLPVLPATSR